MNNRTFISYCWKNDEIVDEIDQSFLNDNVHLVRDKRSTEYKDSFKTFMKQIRTTDYVLMIVSDAYLKSKNCMYEVLETLKDDNFKDRIFPIVLSDANIYSTEERLEYLDYWKGEYNQLGEALSKYSPDEVISASKDLKILRSIQSNIIDFISLLSDLKTIPFETLQQTDFGAVKTKLGIEIYEKSKARIRYDILEQEDVSIAGAKRYSSKILIDSKYSRTEIKTVIKEINNKLKESTYHRNEIFKNHFKNKEADVIWLYFANRLSDIKNCNWICMTFWVNPNLSENMRPLGLKDNDTVDDVKIEWNNRYEEMSNFFDGFQATKGTFLTNLDRIINKNEKIINPLINLFHNEFDSRTDFKSIIDYTNLWEQEINEVYKMAHKMDFAPNDCKELDKLSQSYFAHSHNLFLYWSTKGLETWEERNRIVLMKNDIAKIEKLQHEIKNERKTV